MAARSLALERLCERRDHLADRAPRGRAPASTASVAARTSREPTITPSAPAAAAPAACSGVEMPKPTATGTGLCAFARASTDASEASTPARSPVVPVTETV